MTLAQIREANRRYSAANGRAFWFAPAAMGFFNTTYPDGERVYQGCLFITGEAYQADDPRFPIRYTVQRALPSGQIVTIGEFQQHATLDAAREAANTVTLNA